jgi:hypothetical protein
MKFIRFALLGILLCLVFSCSTGTGEMEFEEPPGAETAEEETVEEEETVDPEEIIQPGPVLLDSTTLSETELAFEFSLPVRVVNLSLSPESENEVVENGTTVTVLLTESPEPGQRFEIEMQVEDEDGNILNVQVNIRFKNTRIPDLQINELRTEYSKPREEFIEFKILSDGNLGALRVFVASNYKNPMLYEFEPVEVIADEYVVLHLRTLDESVTNASPSSRDFWIPGTAKLLSKTDVVYVLDQDDRVLDAVMLAEKADALWSKDYFAEAAEFLFNQNAWKSADGNIPGPKDAVNSTGTTATRTICRDETVENSCSSADWYITVTSGATPGLPNNPNRF